MIRFLVSTLAWACLFTVLILVYQSWPESPEVVVPRRRMGGAFWL